MSAQGSFWEMDGPIAVAERPHARAEAFGVSALSDSELLALMLGGAPAGSSRRLGRWLESPRCAAPAAFPPSERRRAHSCRPCSKSPGGSQHRPGGRAFR